MLEPFVTFILKYKYILLFYLAIIIFLLFKRKRLDVQAKIILLYRTKFGLGFIEKFAQKHRQLVILLGYIGVGAGYLGLIAISYVLIKNLYDLIVSPAAVSGVSLVLPGVNVPGLGILPFWHWLIAIFIIALVHEFSHGIVARAHQLPIKNTGLVFLGPIIGAFVEPDEKKLKKEKDIKQYSVLAAGSFSNILLALVALALLNLVFTPLHQVMVEPTGFSFGEYYGENYPAIQAKIPLNLLITGINEEKTDTFQKFNEKLFCLSPGSKVSLATPEKNYSLTLAPNPDNPEKGFLGIKNIKNEVEIKEKYNQGFWKIIYHAVDWLESLFRWLFILSLGIGLFNLLPLPIVDGGRMLQVYLHTKKGKLQGEKRYRQISMFFLLVLLLNLVYPLLKNLF